MALVQNKIIMDVFTVPIGISFTWSERIKMLRRGVNWVFLKLIARIKSY
jgi:hypothetical protein